MTWNLATALSSLQLRSSCYVFGLECLCLQTHAQVMLRGLYLALLFTPVSIIPLGLHRLLVGSSEANTSTNASLAISCVSIYCEPVPRAVLAFAPIAEQVLASAPLCFYFEMHGFAFGTELRVRGWGLDFL